MKIFIIITAIYNIILGFCLAFPAIYGFFHIGITQPSLGRVIACFAIFTGVVLLISAKRLEWFASIVYWEGLFRFLFFIVLGYYGFFGDLGIMTGLIAIVDLIIGCIYVYGLPKVLGVSHKDLLYVKLPPMNPV